MITKEFVEGSLENVKTELENLVARFNALKGQEAVFVNLLGKFAPGVDKIAEGAVEMVEGAAKIVDGAVDVANQI